MASIANDPGGRKRILFVNPDGDRKAIRLGKVSQRAAEGIKYRVEQLLECLMLKRPMEADLAGWVRDMEPRLAKKLARVGLIPEPEAKPAAALGAFLADFTTRRIDVKPATKEVWSQAVRNLSDHFGADRDLASITEADAEDFKMFLIGEKLAPTTVHKRLQFARMFFRSAKKRKLIADNPFAEVTAKAVMKADRERVRVHSPKTAHHPGKASRATPLFPELADVLSEAFDAAPEGAEHVIAQNGYRQAADTPSGWRNCNLRIQFGRIVRRAGLEPWPRIAMKHYLMVTDADFQRAAKAAQKRAHEVREMRRSRDAPLIAEIRTNRA